MLIDFGVGGSALTFDACQLSTPSQVCVIDQCSEVLVQHSKVVVQTKSFRASTRPCSLVIQMRPRRLRNPPLHPFFLLHSLTHSFASLVYDRLQIKMRSPASKIRLSPPTHRQRWVFLSYCAEPRQEADEAMDRQSQELDGQQVQYQQESVGLICLVPACPWSQFLDFERLWSTVKG